MPNKMSKKLLAFICSLALIFASWPLGVWAAEEDEDSGNIIYHMQKDPGIALADEDSSFVYTDHLMNSGGGPKIVSYNGGKSIHVADRTDNWNGVDIRLNSLNLEPGVEYTFTVTGHVYGTTPPPGSELVFLNPNAFGRFGSYQPLTTQPMIEDDFTIQYKTTFTAADIAALKGDSYFRTQTNDMAKNVPFYVDDIIITKAVPTVIYDLQKDPGISGAVDGSAFSGTDYLTNSGGGTRSIVSYNGGKSIYLTNREADYFAVDIKLSALGLSPNMEYTFTVSGHIDEDVGVPSGSLIVLSNPNPFGPYGQYQWLVNSPIVNGEFTLEYRAVFTASAVAGIKGDSYFRIQTSSEASTLPFYIDNITITEMPSAEEPIDPEWDLTLDSLYETYKNDFLLGNIASPSQVDDDEFVEMFKHHYNVVTAENHMKPEALSQTKGVYTFENADKLVDWALANGIKVHGHVLIWHSQTAAWLNRTATGQPLTRAEAKENLEDYIENVAGHFQGKLISWDVVNEAFADGVSFNGNWKDSLRKNSPWYLAYANGANEAAGESGADYIYDAFVQARLVDPDATLYYNDYNEEAPSKRDAIAAMVEDLNAKWANDPRNTDPDRLLIEGIGMQSHFFTDSLSLENVENAIKRYIETGAVVTVSELDIPYGNYSNFESRTTPLTHQEEVIQAQKYAQLFQIYKKYADSIERVTIWGIADPYSWRAAGYPLLFDRQHAAKEAYYAVIDPDGYLADNPPLPPPVLPEASAMRGTPTIDGEADAIWNIAPKINVNKRPDGQAVDGASAVVRTLWDDEYLYVYAEIADPELNSDSPNPWEQDSIEVFMSETVHRSSEYRDGDGQYRVTYEGNESFRSDSMGEGFESAAKIVDGGYVVEMKIPFRVIEPKVGTVISFDVQINDAAKDRGRLLTTWSDPKANGYNTTENWGELTLTEPGRGPSPAPYVPGLPVEPSIEVKDGNVILTPSVQVKDGVASTSIPDSALDRAFEQANANAEGKKLVTIEVPPQTDATSYEIELPLANLTSSDDTVISIKTEQGTVDLPGDMFADSDTDSADKITIRISEASTDKLGANLRAQIGDRPVISIEAVLGGKVVEWNNPNAPVTVSVPYTPTAEEMANPDAIVIWYIDGQGRATVVKNSRYDAASGMVIFTTTHFSDFAVVFNYKTFTDLANVPWAKQAIDAMAARGIISGTSATSFSPGTAIKRADFVKLLVNLLELEDTGESVQAFDDVSSSASYADAVNIARQHGIVRGKGNNLFGPNDTITRQDMMVMVMRAVTAAGMELTASGSLSRFSDASLVSDYARDSAAALVSAGIVNGTGSKLNPQGTLTRAEAAVILYRLWSRI